MAQTQDAVLAVDIGTTSLKAALITKEGQPLAFQRQPFSLCGTPTASSKWLPAFKEAVASLFAQAPSAKACAICVSGNGPTLVASSGETLSWCDSVASAQQVPTSSLFIPRIVAFKEAFPDAWASSQYVLGAAEYFSCLLTDVPRSFLPEVRFASAYWSKEEFAEAFLTQDDFDKMAPFAATGERLGALTSRAADILSADDVGVVAGLPVYCGCPDFVAALVGVGAVQEGVLCDRAGSSEGVNLCSRGQVTAEGVRTLPSVVTGLWNASVLIPQSGSHFDAFKARFERETSQSIDYDELAVRLIESDGEDALLDQGKYLLIQLALNVQAALVTLRGAADKAGVPFPAEMRVSGGQAKSNAWCQMKADITGMKVVVPLCPDAELLGVAAVAFTGMGEFASIKDASLAMWRPQKAFTPAPAIDFEIG